MQLTERDAAIAYARAWNRLDPSEFLSILSPNAKYASQWVFEELEGRSAIGEYLIGKFRTVKAYSINDPSNKVRVEIGTTRTGNTDRPCAYMKQGSHEAVVIFTIENDLVARYDQCIPQLYQPDRLNVYPI